MGLENAKRGKLLYHLTKYSNLESIIDNGLVSRKILKENKAVFGDVANPEIISRREELGLEKYIPFHFHPYSSFDVSVKSTFANEDLVYICIQRSLAISNEFKILPKHPLTVDECVLYNYNEGFDLIDWDTLMEVGRIDMYAKHVKMAECVTDLAIPIDCFQGIYVKSEIVKTKVIDLLDEKKIESHLPYVNTQPNWF